MEDNIEEQPPRLPLRQKLCFSVGHVLNDVCASMWFTYLLVYFQMVLGWPEHLAGILMLIGQVADALSTPFVGLQADRKDDFWMCRYGRRKTWHLVGTLCVILSFPFIFSPCVGCTSSHHWAQLIYYSAFVCIFQFGWAAVQISHLSLIPDLTPDASRRTGLFASRYRFTVASNVFVYCITGALLHLSDGSNRPVGPCDEKNFQMVVASGLAIGILCSILFHVGVREPSLHQESLAISEENRNSSFHSKNIVKSKKSISELLSSFQLYHVAGIYMTTRLFCNLSQVYTPLYLHEQGFGAESLAVIPLVMFLSSYGMAFIVNPLNKCLGRTVAHVIGCLFGVGACIWIRFGAGQDYAFYEVHAVAVLLGASSSVQLVTSLSLTADYIGDDTDSGAFIYGIMSFVDKLSNGIAVSVLQAYFHDDYRDVLAYTCGAAAFLGIICVLGLALPAVCRSNSSLATRDGDSDTEEILNNC